MINQLATALNFDRQALTLRAERQKVLANNVANVDTPNYKARDFDFAQALAAATGQGSTAAPLALATTRAEHMPGQAGAGLTPGLLYRVPDQPSLDGNTVNMDVERAKFADNTVRYEAAVTLLNTRMRNLKMVMQPAQ